MTARRSDCCCLTRLEFKTPPSSLISSNSDRWDWFDAILSKSDRWQRQSLLQASTPTPSSTTRKTKPWKLELRTKAMRRRLANCKWASRRMRNGEDLISCCIWKRWKVPTWTSGSYIERCLWASVDNVCQIVNLTWTSHGHNSCKCLSIFWCLFGPLLLHIFCLLYVLCCMFGEGAPGRFLLKNLK